MLSVSSITHKQHLTIKILVAAAISFLAVFLLFFKLDTPEFVRWDEQTNVRVVRDGGVFLEKPPLWYSAAYFSVSLGGDINSSYRVVSAASGLIIIGVVAWMARERWGFWSAVAAVLSFLATGHNFISDPGGLFSTHTYRSADLDGLMLAFIMLAVLFASKVKQKVQNWYIAVFLLGLAFLTKGPVALIPLSVIGFYLMKIKKAVSFRQIIISGFVFLLTVLPWHLFMLVSFGSQFISEYINYHLLQRSLTALEGHQQPIWYYLSVLTNWRVFVIWPLLFVTIPLAVKSFGKEYFKDVSLLMIVLTVVVFSLVGTKLAWYILPVYPFAAILIGWLFHRAIKLKPTLKLPTVIVGGTLILVGVIANVIHVLSI